MSESMQLTLVNNDPTSTLFMTPDGEAMYSTATPPLVHEPSQGLAPPYQGSSTTTVKRLNRFHQSTGHVETVVGVVDYGGSLTSSGTKVQLRVSDQQFSFDIAPSPQATRRRIEDRHADSDEAEDNFGPEK